MQEKPDLSAGKNISEDNERRRGTRTRTAFTILSNLPAPIPATQTQLPLASMCMVYHCRQL